MSNQRSGVNQLLGVTPIRWPTNFFFVFLHQTYMSLWYAWWKCYCFIIFGCFLLFSTMQTHAQANNLASMLKLGRSFMLKKTQLPLLPRMLNPQTNFILVESKLTEYSEYRLSFDRPDFSIQFFPLFEPITNLVVPSLQTLKQIYRRFSICSRESLSLVVPNNKALEHWRL